MLFDRVTVPLVHQGGFPLRMRVYSKSDRQLLGTCYVPLTNFVEKNPAASDAGPGETKADSGFGLGPGLQLAGTSSSAGDATSDVIYPGPAPPRYDFSAHGHGRNGVASDTRALVALKGDSGSSAAAAAAAASGDGSGEEEHTVTFHFGDHDEQVTGGAGADASASGSGSGAAAADSASTPLLAESKTSAGAAGSDSHGSAAGGDWVLDLSADSLNVLRDKPLALT